MLLLDFSQTCFERAIKVPCCLFVFSHKSRHGRKVTQLSCKGYCGAKCKMKVGSREQGGSASGTILPKDLFTSLLWLVLPRGFKLQVDHQPMQFLLQRINNPLGLRHRGLWITLGRGEAWSLETSPTYSLNLEVDKPPKNHTTNLLPSSPKRSKKGTISLPPELMTSSRRLYPSTTCSYFQHCSPR